MFLSNYRVLPCYLVLGQVAQGVHCTVVCICACESRSLCRASELIGTGRDAFGACPRHRRVMHVLWQEGNPLLALTSNLLFLRMYVRCDLHWLTTVVVMLGFLFRHRQWSFIASELFEQSMNVDTSCYMYAVTVRVTYSWEDVRGHNVSYGSCRFMDI